MAVDEGEADHFRGHPPLLDGDAVREVADAGEGHEGDGDVGADPVLVPVPDRPHLQVVPGDNDYDSNSQPILIIFVFIRFALLKPLPSPKLYLSDADATPEGTVRTLVEVRHSNRRTANWLCRAPAEAISNEGKQSALRDSAMRNRP